MERIIPDEIRKDDVFANRSLQLHLQRYQFADIHLLPSRVLDIACGAGYGSSFLAQNNLVTEVIGVDISKDAIAYAGSRYAHPKIKFICSDVLKFSDQQKFNTIISLETIEHLNNPEEILNHFHELLLPGGRLIVSAPVTPSMDANPYHQNDFTPASFKKLCTTAGFSIEDSLKQVQPYSLSHAKKYEGGRKGLMKYYLSHPGKFFLRIKSLVRDGLKNKYLILVLKKN